MRVGRIQYLIKAEILRNERVRSSCIKVLISQMKSEQRSYAVPLSHPRLVVYTTRSILITENVVNIVQYLTFFLSV